MNDLRGKTILVTGAGGFIGSRLAETLAAEHAKVKVLLRSGLRKETYQRKGIEVVRGDITLPESLPQAVEDCQIVFHCAVGGDELEVARRINVQGTLDLLKAAALAGTKRFVHVSSVAVHGTTLSKIVREDQPYLKDGSVYAVTKAEGEQAALHFGEEKNLEVVIIRPTLVYGPNSLDWTISLLDKIKYEQILLVGGGVGIANLIYIDDLVQGMILAAITPGVSGEAFFISGSEIVSWREFIGKYARLLGKPMPPSLPLWQAKIGYQIGVWRYRLTRKPNKITPLSLYTHVQQSVYSIEKAQQRLGYTPQFTLDQGLVKIKEWLIENNYLP